MKKKPLVILKETFGLKADQKLTDFRDEVMPLKKHDNYEEFIRECAAYLSKTTDKEIEADFS